MRSDPVFLKDTEVAARFGVVRETVWTWVRKGIFPAPVKLGSRTTRWHINTVKAYEKKVVEASEG